MQFLAEILKALTKASDPLIFGGILIVLVAYVILQLNKDKRKISTVSKQLLYWIISLSTICIFAGLLPKIYPKKTLEGIVYYNCQPQESIEISLPDYQTVYTQPNGRFKIDVFPIDNDSLFLTFYLKRNFLGDRIITEKQLNKLTKFDFGGCSKDTTISVSGYIRQQSTGGALNAIEIFLDNYPSIKAVTNQNGYYYLSGIINKNDKDKLYITIKKGKIYRREYFSLIGMHNFFIM